MAMTRLFLSWRSGSAVVRHSDSTENRLDH
jgi:hypothetical protein